MNPRITVLTPVFNETRTLPKMLGSLADQSLKPASILIGDNESNDESVDVSRALLESTGIPFDITTIKRQEAWGSHNISNAYGRLHEVIRKNKCDYLATIEADVFLNTDYFRLLVSAFEKDSRLGISGGLLVPLGLLADNFPVGGASEMLWGSNRLYRWSCWSELNESVGIRSLPSWDTDHVILALLKGYRVYSVAGARSIHLRPLRQPRGREKGETDAMHGLPAWWAVFKTVQRRDLGYLLGFAQASMRKPDWQSGSTNDSLTQIQNVYRRAASRKLAEALS